MGIQRNGSLPNLTAAAAKVRAGIEVELAKVADDLIEEAKRNVPVNTGALRDSISKKQVPTGWEVGPTKFYGAFVEFGTAKLPPRPFMAPAAEKVEGDFEKTVEKIGRKAIEEA